MLILLTLACDKKALGPMGGPIAKAVALGPSSLADGGALDAATVTSLADAQAMKDASDADAEDFDAP